MEAVMLLSAQSGKPADDLIVPGVRVGPVTATSTEASLIKQLGRDTVKQQVDLGEGDFEPGLVIYKDDPTRRLEIVWNADVPAHPEYVFICRDANYPLPHCRWRTAGGVTLGTTLKELARANGKPFKMVVWGSDVGGHVLFDGGTLDHGTTLFNRLNLTLEPRRENGHYVPKLTKDEEDQVYDGEKVISSTNPVLQKINPLVVVLTMEFPRRSGK